MVVSITWRREKCRARSAQAALQDEGDGQHDQTQTDGVVSEGGGIRVMRVREKVLGG